jgi:hypothetical protein
MMKIVESNLNPDKNFILAALSRSKNSKAIPVCPDISVENSF